jgi:hypothetical protein
VATVLPVDSVYRLHKSEQPLIVNLEQQILLPFGVGHDVCEKDARLVVDEPWLKNATQQRLHPPDERQRVRNGEGESPTCRRGGGGRESELKYRSAEGQGTLRELNFQHAKIIEGCSVVLLGISFRALFKRNPERAIPLGVQLDLPSTWARALGYRSLYNHNAS